MKYHISREQHFFFEQKQFIEFEGLLSSQELDQLCKLLSAQNDKFRDLSHACSNVRNFTHMKRLAKIASELTLQRHLRFGFDQIIELPFKQTKLQNESCIQGLVACLALSLDDPTGHGIYFQPYLDLSLLPLLPQKKYLLIGWANTRAQYVLQPLDPHTHGLKKLGYVFGDRLKEQWHPTIIR